MYEAYQHVMKAQVEFLIGLGVNQALKVHSCENSSGCNYTLNQWTFFN